MPPLLPPREHRTFRAGDRIKIPHPVSVFRDEDMIEAIIERVAPTKNNSPSSDSDDALWENPIELFGDMKLMGSGLDDYSFVKKWLGDGWSGLMRMRVCFFQPGQMSAEQKKELSSRQESVADRYRKAQMELAQCSGPSSSESDQDEEEEDDDEGSLTASNSSEDSWRKAPTFDSVASKDMHRKKSCQMKNDGQFDRPGTRKRVSIESFSAKRARHNASKTCRTMNEATCIANTDRKESNDANEKEIGKELKLGTKEKVLDSVIDLTKKDGEVIDLLSDEEETIVYRKKQVGTRTT